MLRGTLVIILLNILLPIFGQQDVYFNKRIDHYNNSDYSRNIIISDSGYVIAGYTEDTTYQYNIHIAISGVDSVGNTTFLKEYGYDSINMFLGNPGSFIKFSNNYFLTVGTKRLYTDNWVNDQGMILCYNDSFDTIWSRYYGEKILPYDTAYLLYQVKKTFSNSIVLTGIRMPIDNQSSVWIMETDSLGNKLWENFIGGDDDYYYQGHSIVQTNDGGFVIGAVKFKIQSTGGSMDPLIIKTDSLGNEEWRINPGNPDVDDNKVMLALDNDGNIIAGTNYGTQQSQDNRWSVNKILKINPQGEILWDSNYCDPAFDRLLLNTTITDNGQIITNGVMTIFENYNVYNKSWILCVDSTGKQLWYREYALLTNKNSFNDLLDVKQTSDNGFIGCGVVRPFIPDTGSVDIWLMKMDSLGCVEQGCDTTVDIIIHQDGDIKTLSVFPNPCTNNITFKFEKDQYDKFLIIYDLQGKCIYCTQISNNKNEHTTNTNNWGNGLYTAIFSDNKGKIVKCKFVKR